MSIVRAGWGIDLGTANCAVLRAGQKVEDIVHMRSVVAWEKFDHESIVSIGPDAYDMIGREPEGIEVEHAVRRGNIGHSDAYLAVMREAIEGSPQEFSIFWPIKALKERIWSGKLKRVKPVLVVGVPRTSSDKHQLIVRDLIELDIDAIAVIMYEQFLAVIGEKLAFTPESRTRKAGMLSDMGGGTTDNAIYTPIGFKFSNSHDIGGNVLDMEIIHGVRKQYNLRIGLRTAERIKIELASAIEPSRMREMKVKGKSVQGIPKELTVTNYDVYEWLKSSFEEIALGIQADLNSIEEGETHAEIKETGIRITGGTSLTKNMAEFLREKTGLETTLSANPLASVVLGASMVLQDLDRYRQYDLVPKLPRESFLRSENAHTVRKYIEQ